MKIGGSAWGSAIGAGGRHVGRIAPLIAIAAMLAACGGSSAVKPHAGGHGPHHGTSRGTYKIGAPYQVNGVWYYPRVDYNYDEIGAASWYGEAFDGKSTANGEIFDLNQLTAAHRTLPLPSIVEVTNMKNGRTMRLRVNDRGPFAQSRILDVSRRAAQLLGFERAGTTTVHVRILKDESIQVAQAAMRGEAAVQVAQAIEPAPAQPPLRPASIVVAAPVRPAPAVMPARGVRIAAAELPPLDPPRPQPERASAVAEPEPVPAAPERLTMPPTSGRGRPAARDFAWLSPIASARAEPYRHRSEPEPLPPAAAPRPTRIVADKIVAETGDSRIFVQAGAFSVPGNAQKVSVLVASLGNVQITPISVKGVPLYRVRLGPVRSIDEADRLIARLYDRGYQDARIVRE